MPSTSLDQASLARSRIWLPYTQMRHAAPNLNVVSGNGARLQLHDGRTLIDAVASWWCMIHGYRHPELDDAIRTQLSEVSHVMLGGLCHAATERLADKLVDITPDKLRHVFFSDSGSVAVEVALKIACQYWRNVGYPCKSRFVALHKAYHGDTLGCMSVCDPIEGMHRVSSSVSPANLFAPAPTCGFDSDWKDAVADTLPLERLLREHHEEIAAFILEPVMQAAGGFNIYSPHYLTRARELCDRFNVLLVFDEVATGFGRTGRLFAANHANVCPDIMVLGKALTGGYLGHAATLATTAVFESFLGAGLDNALMHGPTFMGNPLACAVAVRSIEIFLRDNYIDKVLMIQRVLREELLGFKSPQVRNVRVLGATGIVEVEDATRLIDCQNFAIERGVWLRPLGHCIYTMPPFVVDEHDLRHVVRTICESLA